MQAYDLGLKFRAMEPAWMPLGEVWGSLACCHVLRAEWRHKGFSESHMGIKKHESPEDLAEDLAHRMSKGFIAKGLEKPWA